MDKTGNNKNFTWIPFYMELANALMRYRNNRTPLVDWIYSELSKIESSGKPLIAYLHNMDKSNITDIDPFSVIAIFNRGIADEKRKLILENFKFLLSLKADVPTDFDGVPVLNAMKSFFFSWESDNAERIETLWAMFEKVLANEDFSKEFDYLQKCNGLKNNLTMALFWIKPYDYLSLDSKNREYLNGIGVSIKDDIDYSAYMDVNTKVKVYMHNGEIPYESYPMMSYHVWADDKEQVDYKIWLVGYSFNSTESQYDRFIKDSNWKAWFTDDKTSDQKLLKLSQKIKKGDILVLKSTSTKGENHNIPFLRVKAVGIVDSFAETCRKDKTTIVTYKVKYISTEEKDFEESVYGGYRKMIHKADKKAKSVIKYVNDLMKDKMNTSKYKEYIELLKANHNLVLTGAPGTGKTYMAKQIAKDMGAEVEFVQFHPSYDYTDFVEGLRPKDNDNGQIGFELTDGVFKAFCGKAVNNIKDSAKSVEELYKEHSFKESLFQFIYDAIDNGTEYKLSKGNVFTIEAMDEHRIIARNNSDIANKVIISVDMIMDLLNNNVTLENVKDVRKKYERKYNTQADSYVFTIVNSIRNMQADALLVNSAIEKVKPKDYVFIIDEINRGDISKIFGELFFAIDSGYRVKSSDIIHDKLENKVTTQYQNLITTGIFSRGFYIPENVYILATMNDIDRSVESMDFAMRRRFVWKEVKPNDTEDMLNTIDDSNKAKETMYRLNEEIEKAEGLGAEYSIGPAYFLKLKDNCGDINKLWKMNIEPLLKEYTRGLPNSSDLMSKFEKAFFRTSSTETTNNGADANSSDR